MQGINLHKAIAYGLASSYDYFDVFFFDGQMPESIESIPFDLNYVSLMQNSIYQFIYTTLDSRIKGLLKVTPSVLPHWCRRPVGVVQGNEHSLGYNYISAEYFARGAVDDIYPTDSRDLHSIYGLILRAKMANESENSTDVGRGQIPIFSIFDTERNVTGFVFKQSSVYYTYGGGRRPAYAYARSVDLYYWSDAENEGAGGWVHAQQYTGLSTGTISLELDVPVVTKAIKLVSGADGAWTPPPGNALYGNPQWRVFYFQAMTDEPVTPFPDYSWCILIGRNASSNDFPADGIVEEEMVIADSSVIDVTVNDRSFPFPNKSYLRFDT